MPSEVILRERENNGVPVALTGIVEPATVATRLETALFALLQTKTVVPGVPVERRLFLTMAESAQFSGLPAAFLRRLVSSGKLRALRTGAGWRIARVELETLSGTLTDTPRTLTEHELRDMEINRRRRQGNALPSDNPDPVTSTG